MYKTQIVMLALTRTRKHTQTHTHTQLNFPVSVSHWMYIYQRLLGVNSTNMCLLAGLAWVARVFIRVCVSGLCVCVCVSVCVRVK